MWQFSSKILPMVIMGWPKISSQYFHNTQLSSFHAFTQSCQTLRHHESKHARPPYPSPTPKVYPDSCPLNRWCHPAISSSVSPFSSCPQSLPASGPFQWVNSSQEVAKILEFQPQHQSFQWHVGSYYVLAIVNSAHISIVVHVSFGIRIFIFFQIYSPEWDCRIM